MILLGIAGLILASFALWVRQEKLQDILFVFGGVFLLVYSISLNNLIFSILQAVFIASALFELIKLNKK